METPCASRDAKGHLKSKACRVRKRVGRFLVPTKTTRIVQGVKRKTTIWHIKRVFAVVASKLRRRPKARQSTAVNDTDALIADIDATLQKYGPYERDQELRKARTTDELLAAIDAKLAESKTCPDLGHTRRRRCRVQQHEEDELAVYHNEKQAILPLRAEDAGQATLDLEMYFALCDAASESISWNLDSDQRYDDLYNLFSGTTCDTLDEDEGFTEGSDDEGEKATELLHVPLPPQDLRRAGQELQDFLSGKILHLFNCSRITLTLTWSSDATSGRENQDYELAGSERVAYGDDETWLNQTASSIQLLQHEDSGISISTISMTNRTACQVSTMPPHQDSGFVDIPFPEAPDDKENVRPDLLSKGSIISLSPFGAKSPVLPLGLQLAGLPHFAARSIPRRTFQARLDRLKSSSASSLR